MAPRRLRHATSSGVSVHLSNKALGDGTFVATVQLTRATEPASLREIATMANLKPKPEGCAKLLHDRQSAAEACSVSLRTIDYALARREFETRRIGRRTLITDRSLRKWASQDHFGPVSRRPSVAALCNTAKEGTASEAMKRSALTTLVRGSHPREAQPSVSAEKGEGNFPERRAA
jgi:hypothetical protein